MARSTTEADVCAALGVNQKTLQRWRNRTPPVPHTLLGRRPFYDLAEVRVWMQDQGVTGEKFGSTPKLQQSAAAPPGAAVLDVGDGGAGPARDGVSARALAARAQAAVQGQKAKRAAEEARIRAGLAELQLGEAIAKAQSEEDLFGLAKRVGVLLADGKLLPDMARALIGSITEARQNAKARPKSVAEPEYVHALVCSAATVPLVSLVEGIVDVAQRARVLAFARSVADEDRVAGPRADAGDPTADGSVAGAT